MSSMKSGLKKLYGSKFGKLLPALLIAALVATASAAVFVNYYGSATVTAQTNNLLFATGPDNHGSACGTLTPCIETTLSTPADTATIAMNLGIDSSGTPQSNTTITNALHITNGGSATRTLNVTITSATPSTNFYGEVAVYYCTALSNTPWTSANCHGATMKTGFTAPATVASLQTLASSASGYVEFVGYAGAGATPGTDNLQFTLQFQWA